MSASTNANDRTATSATSAGVPQLRTILLTDLADSTALVEQLGDGTAAELFRAHDGLVLQLQQLWRGRLIDRSDGMLLLFERPIDGLGFVLDYHRGLQEIGASYGVEPKARAGMHVGEVLIWRNSDEAVLVGAKPVEVEGLAKPMAARLMTMARPGQTLLSAVAEPLAHRATRELGERGQHLLWKSHGRWRFKGVPQTQEIFEVGEPGFASLRSPHSSPKVWRDIPLWRRPAALVAQFALVFALAIGAWFVSRPQPALAFHERDWVVLADLRNLTGQSLLDDSLEQAFRISLEQSRHVNVLSDLKTRDTLVRMQREPGTALDRAIASEIAIRDGARAVILPTVAEVGGRVRISAEVIDPHNQTTVYSEYADGRGVQSALGSVDRVTAALRGKLGEALEAIAEDSVPLPHVVTENLDALRAYALGVNAYASHEFPDALQFFQRAVNLDSKFALAHLGMMRVYVSNADTEAARPHLERALSLRDHLTPRAALYLDAWSSEMGPQPSVQAPAKWKLLAAVYPDYAAGTYQYGWGEFLANRFDSALESAKGAVLPQEPLRNVAFELQGRIYLAQERYEAALEAFSQARSSGMPVNRRQAAALAATKQFKEAGAVLASLPADGLTSGDLTNEFERIAVPLDQGRFAKARRVARQAADSAENSNPLLRHPFKLVDLWLGGLVNPDQKFATDISEIFNAIIKDAVKPGSADRDDLAIMALAAIRVMQRQGNSRSAGQALERARVVVHASGNKIAADLLIIAEAEQLRLSGSAERAIKELRFVMDGSEPFQAHVALRDALRDGGHREEALAEDRWLMTHRGRAYSEPAGGQVFQAMNVADTTLAHLDAAEILVKVGRLDQARREAEAFRLAWGAELPDYLRRRLEVIMASSKQKTTV